MSLRYSRYGRYFDYMRVTRPDGMWYIGWKCRVCGKVIKPNTAGAQSHVAKHVRERTK